jgi:hypothetical protein
LLAIYGSAFRKKFKSKISNSNVLHLEASTSNSVPAISTAGGSLEHPPNFNLPIPPPGRDGDLIAFGNTVVVMIDSYHGEEYRIIDMTTPITEHTKEEMPLYYYYSKHGIKIIHWWAAVMGCESRKSNVE